MSENVTTRRGAREEEFPHCPEEGARALEQQLAAGRGRKQGGCLVPLTNFDQPEDSRLHRSPVWISLLQGRRPEGSGR